MTRGSYRFRHFAVVRDEEPDTEPQSFTLQCSVCEESGPPETVRRADSPQEWTQEVDRARNAAATWLPEHRSQHPEHYSYRLLESTPYRLVPGEWQ